MKISMASGALCCALSLILPPAAQSQSTARPDVLLEEVVAGMPRGETQQVRILTATLKPVDRTVFHTHPFPVSVFILEGTFTLEMDGREPLVPKAGQAYVEPPNVRMTGYNRSGTDPVRVVIFYVSDPKAPFLHPVQ